MLPSLGPVLFAAASAARRPRPRRKKRFFVTNITSSHIRSEHLCTLGVVPELSLRSGLDWGLFFLAPLLPGQALAGDCSFQLGRMAAHWQLCLLWFMGISGFNYVAQVRLENLQGLLE
jgi:hypothetical protein